VPLQHWDWHSIRHTPHSNNEIIGWRCHHSIIGTDSKISNITLDLENGTEQVELSYQWKVSLYICNTATTYFMAPAASQTKSCFHRPYFNKAVIRTSNNITPRAIKGSCRNRITMKAIQQIKKMYWWWSKMVWGTKDNKAATKFVNDIVGERIRSSGTEWTAYKNC